jgi:hypothetical protein
VGQKLTLGSSPPREYKDCVADIWADIQLLYRPRISRTAAHTSAFCKQAAQDAR